MTRLARVIDAALEASIVGSFTRVGYHARRRLEHWPPLESLRMDGTRAIVTGATAGLGRALAELLARAGAAVCIVGRDPGRTEQARAAIEQATGTPVESLVADLSLLADVRTMAEAYAASHDRLDLLVHNAGALLASRTVTSEGLEVTVATHVLAPFLATGILLPLLEEAAPGRVVTVASGGMYTAPLDVASLAMPDGYDGVRAYARAKRAQVALAGEWTRRLGDRPVLVTTMHPGWAATRGIGDALPRFSRLLAPVLRTPVEGVDTIVWLATAPAAKLTGGAFYLDRRPRALHRIRRTRRADEAAEAARLWAWCATMVGGDPLAPDAQAPRDS